MKSPILFASEIYKFTQPYLDVLNNTGILAVHKDPLGVQARKLAVDGKALRTFTSQSTVACG